MPSPLQPTNSLQSGHRNEPRYVVLFLSQYVSLHNKSHSPGFADFQHEAPCKQAEHSFSTICYPDLQLSSVAACTTKHTDTYSPAVIVPQPLFSLQNELNWSLVASILPPRAPCASLTSFRPGTQGGRRCCKQG